MYSRNLDSAGTREGARGRADAEYIHSCGSDHGTMEERKEGKQEKIGVEGGGSWE